MSITGQLWCPPPAPHAYDDEFEGVELGSAWVVEGTLSSSAPSLDAAVTGGDIRIAVGQRSSWLSLQAGSGGADLGVYKTPAVGIELPNGLYWCRYAPRWRFGSVVDNDAVAMFVLHDSAASFHDEGFRMGIETDAAQVERSLLRVEGGGFPGNVESADIESRGEPHQYLAYKKTGQTIDAYSGNGAGQWVRFGSSTYAGGGILDSFGFLVKNTQSTNPGSMIQLFDFVRYRADGELP